MIQFSTTKSGRLENYFPPCSKVKKKKKILLGAHQSILTIYSGWQYQSDDRAKERARDNKFHIQGATNHCSYLG